MKNSLDDLDADSRAPSPKRIKLEQDADEAARLLSGSISSPLTQLKRRGRLAKSSNEDRARALLEDPRISAVEPQQVLCRMCGHWIRLFKHIDYGPANWHTHAEKCEVRSKWKARVKREPGCIFTLTIPPLRRVRSPSPSSAPARIFLRLSDRKPKPPTVEKPPRQPPAPSPHSTSESLSNYRARGKTTDNRRKILEADKRALVREPHRVLCGSCETWVKLHNTREYDLWNWNRHIERCRIKATGSSSINAAADIADKSPADSPGPITPVETLASAPDIRDSSAASEADVEAAVGDVSIRDSVDDDAQENATERQEAEAQRIHVKSELDDDVLLYPTPDAGTPAEDLTLQYPASDAGTPEESASATKSGTKRKNKKGRSIEERKKALEEDTRCTDVRPHEVFCLGCKRWIQLYQNVTYIESNWSRHAERCFARKECTQNQSGAAASTSKASMPTPLSALQASSSKTAESEAKKGRHQDLRCDKRIKTVEPHRVLCGLCDEWVKLRAHREYDGWLWRSHITACAQRQPTKSYSTNHYPNALYNVSVKMEDNDAGTPASFNAAPATVQSVTAPARLKTMKVKDGRSPDERRDILIADERCKDVEPHRVMCKICLRHVGLHSKKPYSLANWYKHINSCIKKAEKKPDGASTSKQPLKTPLTAIGYLRAPARESDENSIPHTIDVDASLPEDSVSVKRESEPIMTEAQQKNSEERRAKMLEDRRIEELEPHRVRCKFCQNWFKLHKYFEYASYNWEKHIEICEKRHRIIGEGTSAVPYLVKEEEGEEGPYAMLDPLASYNAKLSNRKRTTPQERLAFMQSDPRIKTIEKHRAQCGLCQKWVKLQAKIEYEPHNWQAHIKKCEIRTAKRINQPEDTPGSVVDLTQPNSAPPDADSGGGLSAEERRAVLEKDLKCSMVEPHRVLCGMCQQWIKLRDEREYVPYNWFKHKGRCEKRQPRNQLLPSQLNLLNESASAAHASSSVVKQEPVSISIASVGRGKKTDEQRASDLRADPRQAGVEPGRVFCRMCKAWIRLNTATGYLPSNWLRHAQRCQRKTGWKNGETFLPAKAPPELQAVEVVDLDQEGSDSGVFGFIELGTLVNAFEPTVSSTHYGRSWKEPVVEQPSRKPTPTAYLLPTLRARPSTPLVAARPPVEAIPKAPVFTKRMHRPEQLRKEELEKDPRTKTVLADQILCRMCNKWIQMRRDVSFSPQNWLKHAGICEVRTGWVKKHKADAPTSIEREGPPRDVLSDSRIINAPEPDVDIRDNKDEVVQSVDELPYNARAHMSENEKAPDIPTPHFKPVKWSSGVIYSDEEEAFESDVSEGEEQRFGSPRPIVHQVQVKGSPHYKEETRTTSADNSGTTVPMDGIEPTTGTTLLTKQDSENKDEKRKTSTDTPPTKLAHDGKGPVTDLMPFEEPIDATPAYHHKRTSSKAAHLPPFTKAPLMRHGFIQYPFGHRAMVPVMHAPAMVSHTGRTPTFNGFQRSRNGTYLAPPGTLISPAPVPYINILPHLLPKTMVYTYGKGPLPSPFLTPATPPVLSPYANPSATTANSLRATPLPTPPATAESRSASPNGTLESTMETALPPDETTTATDAPVATLLSTDTILDPESSSTMHVLNLRGEKMDDEYPSSRSGYGPTKPGILQLAPSISASDDIIPNQAHDTIQPNASQSSAN